MVFITYLNIQDFFLTTGIQKSVLIINMATNRKIEFSLMPPIHRKYDVIMTHVRETLWSMIIVSWESYYINFNHHFLSSMYFKMLMLKFLKLFYA